MIKMQLGKLTLTGLVLAFGLTTNAQDNHCGENAAEYKKHEANCNLRFNSKQYAEALPFFQKAWQTCPTLNKSETQYKVGIKIYKEVLKGIDKSNTQTQSYFYQFLLKLLYIFLYQLYIVFHFCLVLDKFAKPFERMAKLPHIVLN
jgi:hypothetical protein